jgi:hypothetical protein
MRFAPLLTLLLMSCGRVVYQPDPGQIDADEDGVGQDWDCDDNDPTVSPLVEELCNGVDDNCNGRIDEDPIDGEVYYSDIDRDGYGDPSDAVRSCVPITNRLVLRDDGRWDCNDRDPSFAPDQPETCDAGDQNCDGDADLYAIDGEPWYQDADQDLYFATTVSVLSCSRPTDWPYQVQSLPGDDCDDANREVNPSRIEIWYDGFDQNCDGLDDFDADGDGFKARAFEPDPELGGGDCDDATADVYPGAPDAWYDGVDANCDGASDYDQDGDGFDDDDYGGEDCDDENAEVHPDAEEIEGDGADANCNGRDDT